MPRLFVAYWASVLFFSERAEYNFLLFSQRESEQTPGQNETFIKLIILFNSVVCFRT